MSKEFILENIFPRTLGIGVFSYLVFSLVIKGDTVNILHIWMLLIMFALVFAPTARHLKIFNIIDFSSKINDLQKEQEGTKTELKELKNQISSYINVEARPEQKQLNIINLGEMQGLLNQSSEIKKQTTKKEAENIGTDPEYARQQFLIRANGYRFRAHAVLNTAQDFQKAILERDIFGTAEYRKETEAYDMDGLIKYNLKMVLEKGLKTILPILIIDEETGKKEPLPLDEIENNLKEINTLLDLRQKVLNKEIELPEQNYIEELFDKVNDGLANLGAGVTFIGANSIIGYLNVRDKIEEMKKEIEGD